MPIDYSISPLMNLRVPAVGVDPGPDWAYNLNISLGIIDGHNHTPGNGALITPLAIDINSPLSFNDNSAIDVLSVNLVSQAATMGGTNEIYTVNGDLYYNNGSGVPIQITANGGINLNLVPVPAQTIPASTNVIDWSKGTVFVQTLAMNSTYTFANSLSGQTIVVRLTNPANYTGAFPGSVLYSGGIVPTLSASGTDVFTFINDGLNIYGAVVQAFPL